MKSTTTLHITTIALALALVPACKKDEPKPEEKKAEAQTKTAEPGKTDGKTAEPGKPTTDTPKPIPGTGVTPTSAPLSPASKLSRGAVLAHVLMPNPGAMLSDIKAQIVPAQAAQFVDETFLRTMGAGTLGSRSGIAKNLDLTKPMGCALVDTASTKAPVACVIGYTGGAKALVTDLGEEGKQTDAGGHTAKYSVGGQDIFVDDIGGEAIVSTAADVFEKAKPYIEENLIARAGSVATDLEVVAYPGSLMTRYEAELRPVLEAMGKIPPAPIPGAAPGSEKLLTAVATYSAKANARTVQTFRDMEQFTLAFSVEPAGFVARYALFPVAGSELEAQTKLTAAGPLDPKFIRSLPSSSWAVIAVNSHVGEVADMPSVKEMRDVFISAYADAVGKDPAATAAAVDTFVTEARATYSGVSGLAFMHEPGTLGGLALVAGLQPGKSAREGWKTWSEGFTPEAILGAEAAKKVTWSFQMDAAKAGDVAVDRWIIEPTDAVKADMRKDGGAKLAEWETRMGGLRLVINRVEKNDEVVWVVSPGSDDKYAQSVVDAMGGTAALADDAGLSRVLDRNPSVSTIFAFDVKGMFGWISELMPPEERAKLPAGIGSDLSDVFMAASYGDNGSQSGEIVVSQALIDQLRALAK
ncbi:MAG: hypothetical protein K1X88_05810 [Nannocystaceae bacterium]|nr:hypothetical protein [Nannocystaceae bacterium]